mgnify:CR=1 FL=1
MKLTEEQLNSLDPTYKKWDFKRWYKTGIELQGSHSPHFWAQTLTHIESIYKTSIPFKTLADIGCGEIPIDFQSLEEFKDIEKIVRADGSVKVVELVKDLRVANFNKESLPLEDDEVEFSICLEVIEHMFSTYGMLSELARISKYGFLISKPNTDYKGLKSKWYGEKLFFDTGTPLFDGDVRFEHINFIPNYELFGFARFLGYSCICLDVEDEEMQFFLFTKDEYFK